MNWTATFRAEVLKLRRSGISLLVFGTAAFVPLIVLLAGLRPAAAQAAFFANPGYWQRHLNSVWEAMALMLLPLWLVVVSTLVVQIETRAAGWKQLRAGPQRLVQALAVKLVLVLLLLAALLTVFTLAVWASGRLPAYWHGLPLIAAFPWDQAVSRAGLTWLALWPVAVLQIVLAIQMRSFALPMGLGIGLWVLAFGSLSWPYNFYIPYAYAAQLHLQALGQLGAAAWPMHAAALGMVLGLLLTLPAWALMQWRPPQD